MNDADARIRASFARQTMMHTLGTRLTEVAEGLVVIEADAAPHLGQQQGLPVRG